MFYVCTVALSDSTSASRNAIPAGSVTTTTHTCCLNPEQASVVLSDAAFPGFRLCTNQQAKTSKSLSQHFFYHSIFEITASREITAS